MSNTQKYQISTIVKAFKENQTLNCNDIYEALISEREYQERLWNHSKPEKHTNAEFISFINNYTEKVQSSFFDYEIKPIIRKIAGLALASIEANNSEEVDKLSSDINNAKSINDLIVSYIPNENLNHITVFSALRHLIAKADLMIFNGANDQNLVVIMQSIFMAAISALVNSNGDAPLRDLD